MSTLPATRERVIVVHIQDGHADTQLVHLPAACSQKGAFRFDDYEFPPATWPPACGAFRSGSVYVRGGVLADAPVCVDCAMAL